MPTLPHGPKVTTVFLIRTPQGCAMVALEAQQEKSHAFTRQESRHLGRQQPG